MQQDLSKAGKDIEAALPFVTDIIFDQNNINAQVSEALIELKKLDLEKIVSDALRYADLSEDDKAELKKLKNIPLSIKEKQKKRIHKASPPPPNKTITNEVITILPSIPAVANLSVTSIEQTIINACKENEIQAVQIKLAVRNKLNKILETKLVPIVFRESKKGREILLSNKNICL